MELENVIYGQGYRGGAEAPPPLSNDLYAIHMGLLKLEEILVVFTPIIVGYIAKICNKIGLEIADFNAF